MCVIASLGSRLVGLDSGAWLICKNWSVLLALCYEISVYLLGSSTTIKSHSSQSLLYSHENSSTKNKTQQIEPCLLHKTENWTEMIFSEKKNSLHCTDTKTREGRIKEEIMENIERGRKVVVLSEIQTNHWDSFCWGLRLSGAKLLFPCRGSFLRLFTGLAQVPTSFGGWPSPLWKRDKWNRQI